MKQIVNIAFAAIALLTTAMFVQSAVVSHENQILGERIGQAQQIAATGKTDLAVLRAMAYRVNEAAATDKDLKAVLDRLEINMAPGQIQASASTAAKSSR